MPPTRANRTKLELKLDPATVGIAESMFYLIMCAMHSCFQVGPRAHNSLDLLMSNKTIKMNCSFFLRSDFKSWICPFRHTGGNLIRIRFIPTSEGDAGLSLATFPSSLVSWGFKCSGGLVPPGRENTGVTLPRGVKVGQRSD